MRSAAADPGGASLEASSSKHIDSGVRLKSVVGYAAAKVIPGLIVMASISVWLHQYGAAAYGEYAIIWATVVAVSSLGTGWLRQAALRFAGIEAHGFGQHPPVVLVVAVGAVPLVALPAAYGAGVRVLGGDLALTAAVFVFSLTFGIYTLTRVVAQRDGKSARFNAAECSRAAVTLVASIGFGYLGHGGAVAIIAGAALGNVIGVLITSPSVGLTRRTTRGQTDWRVARNSWEYGWPMSIWLGVAAATLYSDRLVLGNFVDGTSLGSYAAASDLVIRGVSIVAIPVTLAVHPVVMRIHNFGDHEESLRLVRRWSYFMGMFLIVVVSVLAILGPSLLSLMGVSGVDRHVVTLLGLGAGLWQYALLAHKPLELAGRTRAMMGFLIVALVSEVAVAFALAPSWGGSGAATGLVIGSGLYLVLVTSSARRMNGVAV